jgi:hypothetical protein
MSRKVHLYVSTKRFQDATTSVVNNFVTGVTANGGTCEATQCMFDYLTSLGGISGLLTSSEKLELFDDEQIQVTSTVQNVQDISKTFTDFSQSFTIPANDHNNGILQHFYQSDVNALIDYNIRLDSFIEIDLTFFRRGKLQIEKANLKNGRPESYSVTFYGDGRTLKDYFGEDLLSDLDYTDYNHVYTGTEVRNRIEDGTNQYDVKYPLISSKRIWHYQSNYVNATTPNWLDIQSISDNNIYATSGAVKYNELFPAVRVSTIFDLIQAKYGVTFNGTFLQDDRFTKLFLYYKNKGEFEITGGSYDLDFTSVTPTFTTYDLTNTVDLSTNEISVQFINGVATHNIGVFVNTASNSSTYILDVYQNGNLVNSIQHSGTGSVFTEYVTNTAGLDTTYSFKIRPNGAVNLTLSVGYAVTYFSGLALAADSVQIAVSNLTMTINQNLAANAPQMKIADFFAGILKVFNMVCVGTDENTYDLAPLDDWYGQGAIVDITEYTDIQSIDVARMPLYKKITFKYQDSECFLNKQFSQVYSRGYGDMTYQYPYDGGEFTVDLPFENILQQKFDGTELQVGYALNNEFAPYTPKPILLYQYDNLDCDFKLMVGSHVTITNYTPFGQDLRYNNTDLTSNFAPETSSLLLYPIQQTLFAQYYFSYLFNLYNLKQRLINVKTIMPVGLMTNLKLNDRVIIRDKRYIINDMKSNLTSGEVDLSLYLDFRPMINKVPFFQVPTSGGSVATAINLPNGASGAVLTPSSSDVTVSQTSISTSQNVTITVGAASANTAFTVDVRYDYTNGSTTTETINIVVQ